MSILAAEEPPCRVRRLPFQDNIHTSIFTPREYQVELLDAARKKNIMVCLGSSSGKTFITVMLIRELAHQVREKHNKILKRTVVLVNTGSLVPVQAGVIRDHTDLTVGEYSTATGIDDWTKEWEKNHILVMCTTLFLELVQQEKILLSAINLLVIGECQQANRIGHPSREIMKSISCLPSEMCPRVLGVMTNIMNSHCEDPCQLERYLHSLEKTMNCLTETSSDIVSLSRFGKKSNELVVQCHSLNVGKCECSPASYLEKEIRDIIEPALEFMNDHVYRPEEIYGMLDEDLNIPDPKTVPKFYLNEILHILTTLGPWCTDRAARRFLKELKKHKDNTPYERHYLLISMVYTTMEMIHAVCDYHFHHLTEVDRIMKYTSSKVLRLLEILQHYKSSQSSGTENAIQEIKDKASQDNTIDQKTNEDLKDKSSSVSSVKNKNIIKSEITHNVICKLVDSESSGDTKLVNSSKEVQVCNGHLIINEEKNFQSKIGESGDCFIKEENAHNLFNESNFIDQKNKDNAYRNCDATVESFSSEKVNECENVGTNKTIPDINNRNESTVSEVSNFSSKNTAIDQSQINSNTSTEISIHSGAISSTKKLVTSFEENHLNDKSFTIPCDSVSKFNPTDKYPNQMNRRENSGFGHRRDHSYKGKAPSNYSVYMDDPNALCGVVFVDRRNTACILHLLLKELSRHHSDFRFLSPNFLVGQGRSIMAQQQQQQQQQQALENRDVLLEHRKQEEVLRRFRLRECNLLVATSVLQDGVDIPKCNLVVRFDLPKDYRAYVQSKGRTRASSSNFILLVESNETAAFMKDLSRFKTVEEVLLHRCHEREIPVEEEVDCEAADNCLLPYIPMKKENAAKVTMSSAIALVNRYCAKLPSDTFTRLTPRCMFKNYNQENGKSKFQAILFLPINSPVKEPIIGPVMPNQALAKMAVALKTCIVLHKSGELDDNLLPVGKESVQYEEELLEKFEEEIVPEGTPKPGTTKRRQYYYKKTAEAFTNCQPQAGEAAYLYTIDMKLTCPIPEEQNTRGRRIYAPEETSRCFGIVTCKKIPKICGFPVFTRSGEVTVKLEEVDTELLLSKDQLSHLSYFHFYTFSNVLRLEKYPMNFDPDISESSFYIVPLNKANMKSDFTIDWEFVALIHTQKIFKPRFIADEERNNFKFDLSKYQDSVVMPWYRNLDQPQYFYVAEICYNLNPKSDFPDDEFETFEKYYFKKYGIQIQNLNQPLLDVDHTSARLNLLTPRYVNRKGVALPTSSEETKRAKRENLQQKQILVPELCTIHPFPASFWRKAVCLPCVLYRVNSLLIAEQLRVEVANEIGLGLKVLESTFDWPVLDFGWSLADVLKAQAAYKEAPKNDTSQTTTNPSSDGTTTSKCAVDQSSQKLPETKLPLKKKEGPRSKIGWNEEQTPSCFDIGTWSNDMAFSPSDMLEEIDELDMALFDTEDLSGNVMMLNGGGIFGIDPELESTESMGWQPIENPAESCQMVRYGSPSNFEDTGWDFDCGEEVDIMNIPGFSFISAPNGGFNMEDLTKDIEAYEEDGIYQMQTETFDDDEDKGDYPNISYWDSNAEETDKIETSPEGNKERNQQLDDEDIELIWEEDNIDDETKIKIEIAMKEYFELVMENKKSEVNFLEADDPLHITIGEMSSKKATFKIQSSKQITKPIICNNFDFSISDQNNLPGSPNLDLLICSDKFSFLSLDSSVTNDFKNQNSMESCFPNLCRTDNLFKANGCDNNAVETIASKTVIQYSDCETDVSNGISNFEQFNKLVFSFDEQTSLDSHPGPSPSVLLQALTMSNANDGINLERLETIGDSFLKHAITTYLYCTYSNIHEGKLSYLRSKQVSNLNLYRLGRKKGFGECMVATKFEPNDNWLPPGYFVPKELEQALIDSGIPAGHWNIANLPDLNEWKVLDAEQIRKALSKPGDDEEKNCSGDRTEQSQNMETNNSEKESTSISTINQQTETNPEDMSCFIPYNLMTQHSIPDKSIADCVEALIGAYLTSCGPRGALLFMSWLGIKVLPRIESSDEDDADKKFISIPQFGFLKPPSSPLLHIVPNPEYELKILLDGYDSFERRIGYQFQDRSYLLQAFTHASYHYNRLTDCYQRLEFLGDAVLDYLITRHLYEDPRQHSPGTLTDLRSALVNNTIFATLAVKYDFHKYFKAICPGLFVVIDKFVKMQKENNHKLHEEFYFIEEDECEEAEDIEVPKALGDVFESIAGAIYLDSGMSLDTVWKVYYSMMKQEIEQFMTNVPKSPIRELLEMEPETAKFGIPEKTLDGKVRVTVEVFGKGKFRGLGRNYRIAKCTAAKHALKALKRMQNVTGS